MHLLRVTAEELFPWHFCDIPPYDMSEKPPDQSIKSLQRCLKGFGNVGV